MLTIHMHMELLILSKNVPELHTANGQSDFYHLIVQLIYRVLYCILSMNNTQ